MTRPAWAPECTCGETPLGYFCYPCHAWAGSSHGEQASWSKPRTRPYSELREKLHSVDRLIEEEKEVLEALAPGDGGTPCKNGRYAARAARAGEKLLPCGCPLGCAPRECIDAVAVKTVTVKRRGLEH